MDSSSPKLRPTPEGWLAAETLPQWPFMAPALHGELSETGELTIGRWGVGEVGRLQVAGLQGPFTIAPNRLAAGGGAAVIAARSAPALLLQGATPEQIHPGSSGRMRVERRGDDWL